ncbi:MAG TPA: helix-turn-helix transcriptional regulator [Pyrinomonadaceae bacterium]|nr:helix-turn-helix transcriptional regulator [Pyrinomonadaceae bacterium]
MGRESLGEFVRRIRTEKNLSCADVSKRSSRKGQRRIAGSYINRIENHPNLSVTADRLKALADGLGVPAEELFARVVGLAPEGESSEEIELLARFRELSPERRDDLLRLVDLWYQKDRCPKTA